MPVGEVRVGHGIEAPRVGRVRDVKQQPVAFAGPASQADGRVQGDVVALGGAGSWAVAFLFLRAHPLGDHRGEGLAERRAVGRRRVTAAAALGDNVFEHGGNYLGRHHVGRAHDLDHEVAPRPRRLDFGEVFWGQAMLFGSDEVFEDAWRAHDGGLFRIIEGHPDDLDSEQRRVWVFVRRGTGATGNFFGGPHRGGARDVDVDVLVVVRVF